MDEQTVLIKMALHGWNQELARATNFISALGDEKWYEEVAPGRNRIIYLVGHLTAVSDNLFAVLGLGENVYPELSNIFLALPDKAPVDLPSVAALKTCWDTVHVKLSAEMDRLSKEAWFSKHEFLGDEEFLAEPYRNKLAVLFSRTRHFAYHMGQIRLIR